METVTLIFVAIHIIGAAALVGGWLAKFKNPTVTLSQWWGSIIMLVSGLILVGLAEMGDGDGPNHVKIAVKLGLALLVFITAWIGRRKENRGQPVPTGIAHSVGGLSLINLVIAVVWQ